jgi:hypothetical protein
MSKERHWLRTCAKDQPCVRCKRQDGSVVLAHYTGVRRLDYGGGFGVKVNDLIGAHLCAGCHKHFDQLSRSKASRWEHSEEFLHYCVLTILRLEEQRVIQW